MSQSIDPLKQARFGAVYVVYDDVRWLPFSYNSIYSECDRILFLIAYQPWNGPKRGTDQTIELIKSLSDPDKKMELVRGDWCSETEQRNAGLELLRKQEIEYCLVVDADEIYDTVQLRRMMIFATCVQEVDCWHIQMVTYWKSPQYRIDPAEKFQPVVLLRVGSTQFIEHRNVAGSRHAAVPPHVAVMHHMSYARSDEEVLNKIQSFSHAAEVVPDWYERVWRGWDRDPYMNNLNPAYPTAYKRAVKQDRAKLPAVLVEGGE